MSTLRRWLSLVRFSHSIFALPFALQGAWLAAGGMPAPRVLALVVVCAVAARTAAMAFNRLVDRRIDAANPRTATRELPAGLLSAGSVTLLTALSAAIFVAGSFTLSPLAGWLSFPVLAVLLEPGQGVVDGGISAALGVVAQPVLPARAVPLLPGEVEVPERVLEAAREDLVARLQPVGLRGGVGADEGRRPPAPLGQLAREGRDARRQPVSQLPVEDP